MKTALIVSMTLLGAASAWAEPAFTARRQALRDAVQALKQRFPVSATPTADNSQALVNGVLLELRDKRCEGQELTHIQRLEAIEAVVGRPMYSTRGSSAMTRLEREEDKFAALRREVMIEFCASYIPARFGIAERDERQLEQEVQQCQDVLRDRVDVVADVIEDNPVLMESLRRRRVQGRQARQAASVLAGVSNWAGGDQNITVATLRRGSRQDSLASILNVPTRELRGGLDRYASLRTNDVPLDQSTLGNENDGGANNQAFVGVGAEIETTQMNSFMEGVISRFVGPSQANQFLTGVNAAFSNVFGRRRVDSDSTSADMARLLLYAIPREENSFRSRGCSGAAACGPYQFLRETAANYGLRNINSVPQAAQAASLYFRDSFAAFNALPHLEMLPTYFQQVAGMDRAGFERNINTLRDWRRRREWGNALDAMVPFLSIFPQPLIDAIVAYNDGTDDAQHRDYVRNVDDRRGRRVPLEARRYAVMVLHTMFEWWADMTGATRRTVVARS